MKITLVCFLSQKNAVVETGIPDCCKRSEQGYSEVKYHFLMYLTSRSVWNCVYFSFESGAVLDSTAEELWTSLICKIVGIPICTNISNASKTSLETISDIIYLISHFLKKYGSIKRKWRKDLWKGKLWSGKNSQLDEEEWKALPK